MTWSKIASFILKFRIPVLIIVVGISGFMSWKMQYLELDYGYSGMLPATDPVQIEYAEFTRLFGEDGTLFFFGYQDPDYFSLENYRAFSELKKDLLEINGITSVLSAFDAIQLHKNLEDRVFEMKPIFPDGLMDETKLDSLSEVFRSIPIYKDLVYDESSDTYLVVMTMDSLIINTKARVRSIRDMEERVDRFSEETGKKIHYSGLPYVRTEYASMIQKELYVFLVLSTLITALILFIFFRSWRVVLVSVFVVGLGVICTLAVIVVLDYRITVLTSMIPPVLIVIGIPNCVFLLNRYHQESRKTTNKIKALHRVIEKVGNAIFMTNVTTAAGFATFMVIQNKTLASFGMVASIGIMIMFILSISLIPIIFSFVKAPGSKQVSHLDNKLINRLVKWFVYMVQNRRRVIWGGVILLVVVAVIGGTMMRATGYIVDDLPEDDPLYADLKFFEKHVKGVMPLEIAIDTRRPNGVYQSSFLKKVEAFQDELLQYPELSRSFSIVDGLKYARQAYFNGAERHNKLPSNTERSFILGYLNKEINGNDLINSFIDSTNQIMRVNVRVADVGTYRMLELSDSIQLKLDRYFPPDKYETLLTGSSLTFTKGTKYLVENLFVSLGLAILIIAFFMAGMFRSFRIVFITIFANMLPLMFTAGLMGYVGISIKPSTVLVFSVTFGIAVDTAIHYLAKYRQEIACKTRDNNEAVIKALREVGVSIIYTVCILFLGFGIFMFSRFGGTVAMGLLVSITLVVAVITNLLLVPSLLLKKKRT